MLVFLGATKHVSQSEEQSQPQPNLKAITQSQALLRPWLDDTVTADQTISGRYSYKVIRNISELAQGMYDL